MFYRLKIFIIFFILFNQVFSQTENHTDIWFIENKNQWEDFIRFKADIPSGNLYIQNNSLVYNFLNISDLRDVLSYKFKSKKIKDSIQNRVIHCHAYKVTFLESNDDNDFETAETATDYLNYFIGNDKSKWASDVKKYGSITRKNLYDGIDLKIYQKGLDLKYDLIINKGSSPSKIRMKFEGVEGLKIEKGNLVIKTSVNEVIELKPYSFQEVNGRIKEIKCHYQLNNNVVSFVIDDKINTHYSLTIDPTLIFSTYSGSIADNWGFTATFDQYGNAYSGGIAFGTGFPVSLGAYQVSFAGGESTYYYPNDVAIIKYNADGTQRLFATYLGGNGSELPHSMIVNDNNELLIFGSTGSSDFPMTANAYDATFNGGDTVYYDWGSISFRRGIDIYVVKLNSTGNSLLGSTYIGGTNNDGLNSPSLLSYNYADGARGEIMTDQNNDIYIVSTTFSSNFPVTTGVFQTNNNGGQEGIIVKLNSNLSNIIWSSYLGGSGADAIYGIALDGGNNVYVTGGTSSSNFPTSSNTLNSNYLGGLSDGFIAKIKNDGSTLLKSTYFGSRAYDQSFLIQRSKSGPIYVFGQTEDTTNVLIHNAAWNSRKSGQFISKLNQNLDSIIWSTKFGAARSKPDISPTAFLVDLCDKIYLSGWGGTINGFGGTNGLPITSNAIQTSTDNNDYYFMVMNEDASGLFYGSFFGGSSQEHVDGGTSRFDKKGRIYQSVCAGCGGLDDFPTTPGAWSNTNNSSNCNNAVIKLDFGLPLTIANFLTPQSACAPYTINFVNLSTASAGMTSNWNFGDGSTSNLANPSHTYLNSGIYDITLIVTDTGSCNFSDTLTKRLVVLSNTSTSLSSKNICLGNSVSIGVPPISNPNATYLWTPATNLSNPNISNPIASPSTTTNYVLVINNGLCTDTIKQTVIVSQPNINFLETIITPKCNNDCNGSILIVPNGGNAPYTYIWNTGSTQSMINNICTGTYTATITDNIGCKAIYTKFVSQPNLLQATVINQTPASCENICNAQANIAVNGGTLPYNFLWSNGNTNSLATNLCFGTNSVTITDKNNCIANVSINIDDTSQLAIQPNIIEPTCYGICNGTIEAIAHNGLPPYTYLWNNGNNNHMLNNVCASNVSLTVTDAIGCIRTGAFTINNPPELTISSTPVTNPLCHNDCNGIISIEASGGTGQINYFMDNNAINNNISNLCAGTYQIKIVDSKGCEAIKILQLVNPTPLNSSLDSSIIRCAESCRGVLNNITNGGTPPYTYNWSDGQTNSIANNLCEGKYNLTITDAHNCKKYDSSKVELVPTNYIFNINSQMDTVWEGQKFNLIVLPSEGFQYHWQPDVYFENPNSSRPTASIPKTTEFIVKITDTDGCEYFISKTIYVKEVSCKEPNVWLPNSFTPNGDNLNDKIYVRSEIIESFKFTIFDRWGEKVFETSNINEGWDGTYRGKPCNQGVFVYYLDAKCYDKTSFYKSGNITLIR